MILSIDPGVRVFYWARWFETSGTLHDCGVTPVGERVPDPVGMAPHLVVVEKPQVDSRTSRVRLQDVLDLCMAAGLAAGAYPGAVVKAVQPRDWKGTTPKRVTRKRVQGALKESERLVFVAGAVAIRPSDLHNLIDAVAIGLEHLGRI